MRPSSSRSLRARGTPSAPPSAATVTIADNDPVVVTVVATDPTASETGPDTGTFTVSRTGPTTAALTVSYAVTGTATAGSDYIALTGSVVIPGGSASAPVVVTPIDDAVIGEGDETVILTLAAAAGYVVGTPSAATVTIADNDPADRHHRGHRSGGQRDRTGHRHVHRLPHRRPTTAALTVNYTVSGTATPGSDYTAPDRHRRHPGRPASAHRHRHPDRRRAIVEGDETVILTLAAARRLRRRLAHAGHGDHRRQRHGRRHHRGHRCRRQRDRTGHRHVHRHPHRPPAPRRSTVNYTVAGTSDARQRLHRA